MGDSGDPIRAAPYITIDNPYLSDDGLAGCMAGLPFSLMERGMS
jgi:hypothetical protein